MRVVTPSVEIPPTSTEKLPETSVAELPSTIGAIDTLSSIVTPELAAKEPVKEIYPQESPTPQQTTPIVQGSSPAPVDIALEMASVPKSTIIAASPRVGKGIVVSMAIAHLRQLHPDLEIWLIDPKDEPTERHYWKRIDTDKRCHFDLRPFDVDVEEAIEVFTEHLTRFNSSLSYRKLLIINESHRTSLLLLSHRFLASRP